MAQRNLLEQNEPLLTEDEQFVSYDDTESLTNLKRNRRKTRFECETNKMLALNGNDRAPLIETGFGFSNYDAIFDGVSGERISKLRKRLCFLVVAGILIIVGLTVVLYLLFDKINPPHIKKTPEFPPSPSILGKYRNAAVASDLLTCSNIGKDILQRKGSSVDAAIAVLICYGVFQPQSSGLGGGFFMTVYDSKTKKSEAFNAREAAPLGASKDMFVNDPSKSTEGGLAIAVPGEVKGYIAVHKKYGKMAWEELFKPSIKLAKDGFKVPKHLAEAFQTSKDKIESFPEMRKTYTNPKTKNLYREGEIIKLPKLAKTLSTLATEGGKSFYTGQLGKDIAQELSEKGALINSTDLKNYVVKVTKSLSIKLRDGSVLYSSPPPSGGAVLSFILNILDGYQMKPESLGTKEEKLLAYHRIIEAFKFAYAKRTDLGDPDFNPANMTQLVKNLTSKSYAEMTRSKIWDNTTHGIDYYGPTFYDRFTKSTAHLSVVGNDGLAVSVTTTVNTRFGSGILGSKTGIVYNNEMDDFSSPNVTNYFGIPPSPANFIMPGKRPLSSMCPAILVDKDNNIKLVVGAAGGSRITTATAWTAARTLWFGENIKQAIDSRRLHHQLLPPFISYEPEFPKFYLDNLEKLNHNISSTTLGQSITNGIMRDGEYLYANCDFRREGSQPAGF